MKSQSALIIVFFALLSVPIVKGENYDVVVYSKVNSELAGKLLSIKPASISIDPEGPVSLRMFSSSEIDSVYIAGLDTVLCYPLEQGQIPPELSKYSKKMRYGSTNRNEAFNLSISGGFAAAGLDYYEGYTSGLSYEFEARFIFLESSARQSGFFVGIAIRHSSIGVENELKNTLIGYDQQSNPVYMVFKPLSINHYSLRFGRSWYFSNSISNFHLVCGISVLDNEAAAELQLERNGEREVIERASTSESKFAGSLSIGVIAAMSSHVGIKWSIGYEIFVTGEETQGGYDETTGGGTLLLDIGLSLEL